jgi:hypothetical protein
MIMILCFFSLSLLTQVLFVEISYSQDVQLQSACSEKFLTVAQNDHILANQNTEYPRKSFNLFYLIFVLLFRSVNKSFFELSKWKLEKIVHEILCRAHNSLTLTNFDNYTKTRFFFNSTTIMNEWRKVVGGFIEHINKVIIWVGWAPFTMMSDDWCHNFTSDYDRA